MESSITMIGVLLAVSASDLNLLPWHRSPHIAGDERIALNQRTSGGCHGFVSPMPDTADARTRNPTDPVSTRIPGMVVQVVPQIITSGSRPRL